jgi:hypothetical protein
MNDIPHKSNQIGTTKNKENPCFSPLVGINSTPPHNPSHNYHLPFHYFTLWQTLPKLERRVGGYVANYKAKQSNMLFPHKLGSWPRGMYTDSVQLFTHLYFSPLDRKRTIATMLHYE